MNSLAHCDHLPIRTWSMLSALVVPSLVEQSRQTYANMFIAWSQFNQHIFIFQLLWPDAKHLACFNACWPATALAEAICPRQHPATWSQSQQSKMRSHLLKMLVAMFPLEHSEWRYVKCHVSRAHSGWHALFTRWDCSIASWLALFNLCCPVNQEGWSCMLNTQAESWSAAEVC